MAKQTPESLRARAKMMTYKETEIPKQRKAVVEIQVRLASARATAKVTKAKADRAKVLNLQADLLEARGKLAGLKAGR